jgi:hypothetical protein
MVGLLSGKNAAIVVVMSYVVAMTQITDGLSMIRVDGI